MFIAIYACTIIANLKFIKKYDLVKRKVKLILGIKKKENEEVKQNNGRK